MESWHAKGETLANGEELSFPLPEKISLPKEIGTLHGVPSDKLLICSMIICWIPVMG